VSVKTRNFTRSKSEKFEKKRKDEKELRRSDTEVREKRNGEILEEEWRPSVEEADEFRKMIEEFIAKQAKFHREESMAIVGA
jgi:hypothetical protein